MTRAAPQGRIARLAPAGPEGITYDALRAEMLAQLPPLTAGDFAPHVLPAIAALGRIRQDYADWLTQFMVAGQPAGIDPAILKMQRQKPQLNRAEKRRLGLRSETPFSRFAFDMLTEKGRAAPLDALRATAMLIAARQAASAVEQRQRDIGVTHYVWIAPEDGQACAACVANNGRVFAWDAPPPGGHPGLRSCCAEGPCRCTAQAVLAGREDASEDDHVPFDPDEPPPARRRLGTAGVVMLAFLVLALLSLLPLLPRWL